jgi:hypothetical protein
VRFGFDLLYSIYTFQFLYDHCRVATLDASARPKLVFWLLLLGKDLGYYAAHRCFHEFHAGWVGHGVHHRYGSFRLEGELVWGAKVRKCRLVKITLDSPGVRRVLLYLYIRILLLFFPSVFF